RLRLQRQDLFAHRVEFEPRAANSGCIALSRVMSEEPAARHRVGFIVLTLSQIPAPRIRVWLRSRYREVHAGYVSGRRPVAPASSGRPIVPVETSGSGTIEVNGSDTPRIQVLWPEMPKVECHDDRSFAMDRGRQAHGD